MFSKFFISFFLREKTRRWHFNLACLHPSWPLPPGGKGLTLANQCMKYQAHLSAHPQNFLAVSLHIELKNLSESDVKLSFGGDEDRCLFSEAKNSRFVPGETSAFIWGLKNCWN